MQACFDEYGGLVHSLARRHLGEASGEMDDAVQEVFIALWQSAHRFDAARGSEPAFIATLAQRKLIDYRRRVSARRRAIHNSRDALQRTEHATPDAEGRRSEQAGRAAAALRELPPEVRNTLSLSIYRGLTYRSVAAALGAPDGTIKSWASRGLQRLREKLHAVDQCPLADVA